MKAFHDIRPLPALRKDYLVGRTFRLRKFRVIFYVAASAILLAILITGLKTSLFLLAEQSIVFETEETDQVRAQAHPFQVLSAKLYNQDGSPEPRRPGEKDREVKQAEDGFATNKMVLVLDFWERMINVQSGLRRLVQLGVDSDFTVVEPFVYESKVTEYFAFPEHFHRKNMTPQTAALYFRTDDLFATNRYMSHAQFRERVQLSPEEENRRRNSSAPQVNNSRTVVNVIQAVVYIDWTKASTSEQANRTGLAQRHRPFHWCDSRLRQSRFPKTSFGWLLGPDLHVQRALCLSSNATVSPARFDATLFDDLFAFVTNGTRHYPIQCAACVTIAFMNYRKHAFSGFVAHTGAMPFKQKAPPLGVGEVPRALAERVHNELLGGRPYVALQLRTGKPFVIFDKHERRQLAAGMNVTRHAAFKRWLTLCTDRLVRGGLRARRELELQRGLGPWHGLGRGGARFYVASDMYNDGWKGGERCPDAVRDALDEAKQRLQRGLRFVHWFEPQRFGVQQDAMGIAGLADAGVCLRAERFVYAVPSNFGRWVDEQRAVSGGGGTVKVDCMEAQFEGAF